MSLGADLENTTLSWLDRVTKTSTGTVDRQNRVLRVGAEQLVQELSTVYGKIQDKGKGQYEAQQLYARLQNMGELLSPAAQKKLQATMATDLATAQKMGAGAATDLAKLIGNTSDTLKNTAKPNIPAINNAGKRLGDFWAKENTLFRDRVTALTQTAAAEGKSWRLLSGQVRELLLLERQAGTESARSTRVNAKLGITARAELIARTEMQTAFIQGKVSRYRELGYGWARWSAASERTCPYCISRDGLVYPLEDVETSIPAHPRCRCSLIPVESPDGWGKGGDKAVDAVGDLDDAYWAEARQKKLQDYQADHPEFTNADMIRYVKTPTNTQNYLRPGDPAPEPVWAPTGSLVPDLNKLSASIAAAIAQQQALAAKKKELEEQAKKEAEALKAAEELAAKLKAEQDKRDSDAMLELVLSGTSPAEVKNVKYNWDGLSKADKELFTGFALGPVKKLVELQYGIDSAGFDALIDYTAKLKLFKKASDKAFDYVVKNSDFWQLGDKDTWDYNVLAQEKVNAVETSQKKREAKKIAEAEKKAKAEEAAKIEAANEDAALFELNASIYGPKDKKLYKDQWDSNDPKDKQFGLAVAEKQIKPWIEAQTGVTPDAYDKLPTYQLKAQLLQKANDMAWKKLVDADSKFVDADKPWWDKNLNIADKKQNLEDALAADLAKKQKAADDAAALAAGKVGTPDEGIFRERANQLQEAADAVKADLDAVREQGKKLFQEYNDALDAVVTQKKILADNEARLAATNAELAKTEADLKSLEEAFEVARDTVENLAKRKNDKTAEWDKLTSELAAKRGLMESVSGTDTVDPKAVRNYNEELTQQQHTLDSLMEVGRDVLRRAGIEDVAAFAGDPQLLKLQEAASDAALQANNLRVSLENTKKELAKEIKKFEKVIAEQVAMGQQKYADANTQRLEKLKVRGEEIIQQTTKRLENTELLAKLSKEDLVAYATTKTGSSDPIALANQVISELISSSPLSRAQAEALVKEAATPAARKLITNGTLRPVKDLSAMVDAVQMFGSRLTMDAYGLSRDRAFARNRRTLFSEANGQGEVRFGQGMGMVNSGSLDSFRFRQTQFHELGHHLEFINNDIYTSAWEFINSRAVGGKSVRLSSLDPKRNYGQDEYAFEGQAISHYVLKDYRRLYQKQYKIDGKMYFPENDRRWQVLGDATEVISMGVEQLASPALLANLAVADPQHLLLALGTVRLSQARSSQVDPGQLNTFLADANDGSSRVTMKTVAKQKAGKGKTPEELKAIADEVAEIERKRAVLEKQMSKITAQQDGADAAYLSTKAALEGSDLTKKFFDLQTKQTQVADDLDLTTKTLEAYEKNRATTEKNLVAVQEKIADMQQIHSDKQVTANTAKALADLRDVGLKTMGDDLAALDNTDLVAIAKDVGVNLSAYGKAEKIEWLYAIEAGATPPPPNSLGDVLKKPSEAYAKLKTPEPVADPITSGDELFTEMFGAPPPEPMPSIQDAQQLGKFLFEGSPDLDAQFDSTDIKVILLDLGVAVGKGQAFNGASKAEMIDTIHQLLGGSDKGVLGYEEGIGNPPKKPIKGKEALDVLLEYEADLKYDDLFGAQLEKAIANKTQAAAPALPKPPFANIIDAIAYGEKVFGKQIDKNFTKGDLADILNNIGISVNAGAKSKSDLINIVHQLAGGNVDGLKSPTGSPADLPTDFAEYIKTVSPEIYIFDPSKPKPKAEYEAEFVNEYWFQGKMGDKTLSEVNYLNAGKGLKSKLLTAAYAEAAKKGIDPPDFEAMAGQTPAKPAPAKPAAGNAATPPPPPPMPDLAKLKVDQLKELFKATGNKVPKATKAELVQALEAMEGASPNLVRNAWAQVQQGATKKKIVIKDIKTSPLDPVTYPKLNFDFDNRGLMLDGVPLQAGPTLSGSTRPVLYLDPATGKALYVLKGGGGSDPSGQNQAELLTQRIYNLLATKEIRGVASHKVTDPSGKVRLANEYVEGAKTIDKLSAQELKDLDIWRKVRSSHATDALVANWDYIGLSNDNIALGADGKLYKIDAGGTLNYRAQGAKKDFGEFPMELWTLREGQGKVAWKNAKEADFKHLWTTQIDNLRAKNLELDQMYYDGTIPDEIAKALTVRTRLMLEANEVVTKSKFNDSTVDQLVEDGLLTWKDVDAAIRAGWESKQGARRDSDFYREVNKAIEEKIQLAVDRNRDIALRSAGGTGTLQPGKTTLAEQLALRGTTRSHFGSDSLLGDRYRSSNYQDPAQMQRLKTHMETVYGKTYTEETIYRMMRTINYYTNGGYKSQISLMLARNKRAAYDALPDHYTSTIPRSQEDANRRYEEIDEAQEMLAALPIYTGGEVFRGMPLDGPVERLRHLELLTSGQVEQVISYSTDYGKAQGFSHGGDYSILFHIQNPKTLSSVRGLSNYESEFEVLVHKYTRLRVDYLSFNRDGSDPFQPNDPRASMGRQLHAFMVEVPPGEAQ